MDALHRAPERRPLGRNERRPIGPDEQLGRAASGARASSPVGSPWKETLPLHDGDRNDDRLADEVVHEGGRGLLVDLLRRADLLDPPLVHHHHAVGDFQRLLLVVGDEHAR